MTITLLLLAGLVALTVGAELLVRGATRLAAFARISPLVVGLTVVAYGTSMPEMTVSVAGAINGQPDVAVGNVVGSNIFNVLFILGLSAVIVPLTVARQLLRFDVPLLIGVSALTWLLSVDGRLSRVEGGVLFAGLVAYTGWSIYASRRESAAVQREYAAEFGVERPGDLRGGSLLLSLTFTAVGLGLLVLGARWFVEGATGLAQQVGFSELLIGLTVVAAGTSLPEVATSVVAAIKGERDIAVGNVIGSNIFNLLGVLGVTGLVSGDGLTISAEALAFDLPVMLGVAAACLPIFLSGFTISRWEGALFLIFEVLYMTTLVVVAYDSGLVPTRNMLWVVLGPLTLVGLLAQAWRQRSAGSQLTR